MPKLFLRDALRNYRPIVRIKGLALARLTPSAKRHIHHGTYPESQTVTFEDAIGGGMCCHVVEAKGDFQSYRGPWEPAVLN